MSKSFVYLKTAAESFLTLFSCFILLTSLLVLFTSWKLSQGPVDMSWAKPFIQSALGGGHGGITVRTEGIVAEWKNFDAPLTLGIANLSIEDGGSEIFSVSQVGLRIAKAPLFFGIISPEAIYIKNPSIRFEKSEDGQLSFLIANTDSHPQTVPAQIPARMTPQEIGDGLFLGGFLKNSSRLPLAKLQSFIIENATISIADKTQNKIFALPNANLTLGRNKNNVNLILDYQAKQGGRAKVNAVLTRKPLQDQIKFILNLHQVETGLWTLHLPNLPGLMREDYSFDGQMTGVFDLKWTLESLNGAIVTSHDNIEQQKFGIAAARDKKTGIIPLEVSLAKVSLSQIASVWPEELAHLNVTEWFTKKLSDGVIKNMVLTLPFKNENGKWLVAGHVSGHLDFENLTCDYRAPLYPISKAYGHAVIENNILAIGIDKAKLEDLDIKNSSVTITELVSDAVGQATVKLNLKGPLTTVFKYISLEPISLGGKIKMDPEKIGGRGDIDVTVTFPTLADLPADQVVAVVDATLTDAKLPGIVRGMDLLGGPFVLKVEKGAFSISGKGNLEGTPLDFAYSEYLHPEGAPYLSDVQAKLVTDDALRTKFGIDISDYVSGKIPVDLAYREKTDGTTEIGVKADLTPGQVFVKPLNYFKKEGIAGAATATLFLKGKTIHEVRDLNVTIGKDVASNGELSFGPLGKENNVISGHFDHVRLGDANDFVLKLEQTSSVLKISAIGKAIDARAFISNKNKDEKPRSRDAEMTIATDSMRMGDAQGQVLTSPKMHVIANPKGQVKFLDLKAKAGKGGLSVNIAPASSGIMSLRMDADDAGATLNILGAYQNMLGGKLVVSGTQIPGGQINDIQGTALITDFAVVKAPTLAQLIGAFSITGLPEVLAHDGISFSRLKSDFIWSDTPDGRTINLYKGATGGGSVGLTFGGIVNQTKSTVDISGTFVPISQINRIVSSIPLIGQLLTGGKNGGIIAATYSMKGPSDDPKVRVNPLSVLAPGFLRSLLFEGGMNSGRDEKPMPQR